MREASGDAGVWKNDFIEINSTKMKCWKKSILGDTYQSFTKKQNKNLYLDTNVMNNDTI